MTQQVPTSLPHDVDVTSVVVAPIVPSGATPDCAASSPVETGKIDSRLAELERLALKLDALDGEDVARPVELNFPADFCLSVVVPVYNEQSTIRAIIAKLMQLPVPTEIVVVDDGSTDGTRDELKRLEGLPNLQIVLKPANEGKGAALRTGFQHVTGSIVLVQDADLEYDPREIPGLLIPIVQGQADVVYGSRFLEDRRSGSSTIHRIGNRMLTIASNVTTGLRLTDMETCYKVFRTDVLNTLTIRQDRFGFEPEITAKLARRGLRFCEVPIHYHARDWDEGKKIGMGDAVSALFCIVRYAWAD